MLRMLSRASPINLPVMEQMNRTTSLMVEKLFLLTLAMIFPPTSSVAKIWSLVDIVVDVLLIILSSLFLFYTAKLEANSAKILPID